jgi:hypothetical protein
MNTYQYALSDHSKRIRYTSGDCVALALAVQELTGWQAVGSLAWGCGGHAMVQMQDGGLLDALGVRPEGHDWYSESYGPLILEDLPHPGRVIWLSRQPEVIADARELVANMGGAA